MTEDLERIRTYVRALVRRERAIMLGKVVLRVGLLLGIALALALAATAFHVDRSNATAALVATLGIGLWAAVAAPLLVGWRATGDRARQARLVEDLVPDLRGRLITAVERAHIQEGTAGSESAGILGLVAHKAVLGTQKAPPRRVHPATRLLRIAATVAGLWFANLLLIALVGPINAVQWWVRGTEAAAAVDESSRVIEGDKARVGDLLLRYTYPDYTGLDPVEVANGTGDAHGPPGTIVEVVARSGQPIDAAAIVAYERPPLDAQVDDGNRRITGTFDIGVEPGFWHILTWTGTDSLPSRDFKITPEPDLPPEVQVDAASDRLEVAVDDPIALEWRARDDYGIGRVTLEIDRHEVDDLESPMQRVAELSGRQSTTPAELGLAPGDTVKMVVAAWDNDAFSGSKAGRSRVITVVVLGPAGLNKAIDERQRELKKLLVDVLAVYLEEDGPEPGITNDGITRYGELVSERYEPISDWKVETWGDRRPKSPQDKLELRVVADILDSGNKLVRFTQVSFQPGVKTAVRADDLTTVYSLRDEAVFELEDGIIAIDSMMQARAMSEVVKAADRLGDVSERVMDALASGQMTPQQMLSELDRMEQAFDDLNKEAADLEEGGMREFVNQRSSEMKSLSDEIKKALEDGKPEEAAELMERLARQMDDFAKGVHEQMEGGQSEMAQKAKKLAEELKSLEAEERALQSETQKLREQADGQNAERAEQLWDELEKLGLKHQDDGRAYEKGLDAAGRPFNEVQRAGQAADDSEHLSQRIQSRDLSGARQALENARGSWAGARFSAERSGTPGNTQDLNQLDRELDEIDSKLAELERAEQNSSPQARAQARDLQQRQQELGERLESAQKDAEDLAQGMSSDTRDMKEALQQAGQEMGEASESLGQGQTMSAEGSEGEAAQRLAEAQQALKQAMRDQQAMGAGPGEPGDGEQGEGEDPSEEGEGGDNGEENSDAERIEIPKPDDFLTPEEYRKQLLEGMEGEVPDQYQALKKRYYEELVRQ